MADFNKLTKAQLIQYVTDLEEQLDEAIKELEQARYYSKLETFKREAGLLGEDLLKVVKFVYELGAQTGRFVHANLPKKVTLPAFLPLSPVEVVDESILTPFEY